MQVVTTTLKELLLDFIEKLIVRNVLHYMYFRLADNLMDDCKPDLDNELLLCYREKEILEIVRVEPNAYKMNHNYVK